MPIFNGQGFDSRFVAQLSFDLGSVKEFDVYFVGLTEKGPPLASSATWQSINSCVFYANRSLQLEATYGANSTEFRMYARSDFQYIRDALQSYQHAQVKVLPHHPYQPKTHGGWPEE